MRTQQLSAVTEATDNPIGLCSQSFRQIQSCQPGARVGGREVLRLIAHAEGRDSDRSLKLFFDDQAQAARTPSGNGTGFPLEGLIQTMTTLASL